MTPTLPWLPNPLVMFRQRDPYPRAGEYVDGLRVGSEIKNVDSVEATLDDYFVVDGVREVPMSAFETTDPYDLFYASDDLRRVERLAEEIRSSGRIDPLIVVIDDEGPYVLEGGHRLAALSILGKQSLPAMVVLDAPT